MKSFSLRNFSALPLRTADDTAEVHALEPWILVRQYICLHIAECRLRLVLDAFVKGLDTVLFEVLMRGYAATIALRSASENSE